MGDLVIPQSIIIQLSDQSGQAIAYENILLYIKTNARRLVDFHLGPFSSDSKGTIQITKTDFIREVEAELDTGFLDYSDIESNYPLVEFRLYTQEEIELFINSRLTIWTKLLSAEKERWESIEELIDFLKSSNNSLFDIQTHNRSINATLDGEKDVYEFEMILKMKTELNQG